MARLRPQRPRRHRPYGFHWFSPPDPTGYNLLGTYGAPAMPPDTHPFHNDAYTTDQAIAYLQTVKPTDAPWCLTVGYVNPHDREFFPAGTEFLTFTNLFADYNQNNPNAQLSQFINYTTTPPIVDWATNALKSPPPFGLPQPSAQLAGPQQLCRSRKTHHPYLHSAF